MPHLAMKKLQISFILLSLLSVTAKAQTTVNSDPVGFVSTSVTANAGGSGTDITFSPSLNNSPAFQGTITAIPSASSLQISGTPGWTANQYATGYYVLIASGNREGLWAQISANTTDTLVVGDSVKIIPFWTLGTLLPDGPIPDGIVALLYDRSQSGINKSASNIYTMYTGYGWYSGSTNGNGQIIYPDESLVIRVPAGQTLSLAATGAVPMNKIRTLLQNVTAGQDQDIRITTGCPVPVSLGSFLNNGAPSGGDVVLLFDDSIQGINKSASVIATYYVGYGWYSGSTDLTNYQIQPSQGIVYRKAAANSSSSVANIFKPTFQP
ncbi:MAG: hypothetical protein B7Z47_06195 [Chthoniobacter sp. 12-60-6]|nr:MAG: hypothetical protein B7Z47_06195 [Chthoniobacter sp. 12-60-6]